VKINGKGISDVSIILYGNEQQLVHTNSQGNFRFYNVDSSYCSIYQNVSISVKHDFKPNGYSHFYVSEHQENMNFESSSFKYIRFRGKVMDRNGNGIPNIQIFPFDNPSLPNQDTFGVRTRVDGRYTSGFFSENPSFETYRINLNKDYIYSPLYHYLDPKEINVSYDFVIDTVISSVPYRLTEPINIYPNPAKDRVNLDLSGIGRQVSSISIFNIDGKLVMKEENISESLKTLDTSTLIKGTYYIQLDIEGGLVDRYTFVKE
ncbi:MAG: T9SS type A sorting domain-containing protein, partial [Candidatus Kapaibacterium sp.]